VLSVRGRVELAKPKSSSPAGRLAGRFDRSAHRVDASSWRELTRVLVAAHAVHTRFSGFSDVMFSSCG
jgi:hypothetical protein